MKRAWGASLVVGLLLATACSATTSGPTSTPAGTGSAPSTASGSDTAGTGAAETFIMPDLVGQDLQLAQDRLQALGSYNLDQEDALGLGRIQVIDSDWKVCSQTPDAGTQFPKDKRVTLFAAKDEEDCP
jgi:hypothetical protein